MPDTPPSLHSLEEGSDDFKRALTQLTGVTEDDTFQALSSDERRALETQLESEGSEG